MTVTDAPDGTRTITEKSAKEAIGQLRQKPGRAALTKEAQAQIFTVLDALRQRYGSAATTAMRRYLKNASSRIRLDAEIEAREKQLAELKARAGVA